MIVGGPGSDVIGNSVSVCWVTNKVVSSAYLNISLRTDKVERSLFIMIYRVGPMPDPCTILSPISTRLDTVSTCLLMQVKSLSRSDNFLWHFQLIGF